LHTAKAKLTEPERTVRELYRLHPAVELWESFRERDGSCRGGYEYVYRFETDDAAIAAQYGFEFDEDEEGEQAQQVQQAASVYATLIDRLGPLARLLPVGGKVGSDELYYEVGGVQYALSLDQECCAGMDDVRVDGVIGIERRGAETAYMTPDFLIERLLLARAFEAQS
jgi:hypothetical protein